MPGINKLGAGETTGSWDLSILCVGVAGAETVPVFWFRA